MKKVGDVSVYSPDETGFRDPVIQRILDLLPASESDVELSNDHHRLHMVDMYWKSGGRGLKPTYARTQPEREISEILRGSKLLGTIKNSAPRVSVGHVNDCPMQINRYSPGDSLPWHEHRTPNSFRNIEYVVIVPLYDEHPEGRPCLYFKDSQGQEYPTPTEVGSVLVFPAGLLHRVEVDRHRIVASINLPGVPAV